MASSSRRWQTTLRKVTLGTVAVAVALFLIWAYRPVGVEVDAAFIDPMSDLSGELVMSSCQGKLTLELEEGQQEVRVHVEDHRFRVRMGGFDCQDLVPFTLNRPLGDRPLMDDVSGQSVPVRAPNRPDE